jgi:signal peptidase I
MSDQTKSRPKSGWLRTLWAGLLSLAIPGLGHIYAGAWRLGLVLFLVGIAFESAWIGATRIVLPTPIALAIVAAAEALFRLVIAADAGRRVRSGSIATGKPWYRSAWVAVVPMIAIGVGWQHAIVDYYRPGWRSFYVPSSSNVPTLLTQDYIMANTHHPGAMPDYGDVVVFHGPKDPNVDYIKRVVGLPGDRVQMRDTILYLNGKAVPRAPLQGNQYRETLPNGRSYTILEVPLGAGANTPEFTVPAGSFFVLGDNRGNSVDSRFEALGNVPAGNVIGRARTIYWSTDRSRVLSQVQ